MVLYIAKLLIIDDNGIPILKLNRYDAQKGLAMALKIVNEKDGLKGIRGYLNKLDKEFKDYLDIK